MIPATTWLAILLWSCLASPLRAGDAVPEQAASTNSATAWLQYEETGYTIATLGVSFTPKTVPFTNEPTAAPGKVIRGKLKVSGNAIDPIAFIWQRGTGKLFLDLNHNENLADDPEGVFTTIVNSQNNYATFRGVHFTLNGSGVGGEKMLADLSFWDYGSYQGCSLGQRSFWQAKLSLHGQEWQVGVVPNLLDAKSPFASGQLLVRPWEDRTKSFSTYGDSLDTFPGVRKLFLDGHAYQLEWKQGSTGSQKSPGLIFAEQAVPLGELKISGKFIRRLVLTGELYLVVLDKPAINLRIPVGTYHQPRILLEVGKTRAVCIPSGVERSQILRVSENSAAELAAGGPLTNSVAFKRRGQNLNLDYQLVGAGGGIYRMLDEDRSKPPEFAVRKGNKQLVSGQFEFG